MFRCASVRSVVRLTRLTSLLSLWSYGGELPVAKGISRSVSQQHHSPTRPVKRSGPTRVYRVPRILKTGGNGRHRCAQTPSASPAQDQTIGTRPHHTPPCQSPLPTHRPPCALPRTVRTYNVVVILDGRPLVVNTCSVREHAAYVITAFTDQFVFSIIFIYFGSNLFFHFFLHYIIVCVVIYPF